jgi:thymidylate synthase
MALPPCHLLCQFYVSNPNSETPRLSCLMYQRSADLGLGIPFNIASYALLTHMIAHVTNTIPHELIIQLGDAHVYKDHIQALEVQLQREPKAFPTLRWGREGIKDIGQFEASDFVVEGYESWPSIKMEMSV